MRTKRRAGLDLIDAIVNTVIMLVLAAILFPVFIRAVQNGHRSRCKVNEKEIAQACAQYAQDYAGRYPPSGPNNSSGLLGNGGGWADSLQGRLKSAEVFQCPDEPNAYESAHPEQVDYGYNAALGGRNAASIKNSGDAILLFEGAQQAGTAQAASSSNTSQVYIGRHLEGSNYAFVDGHVKWLNSTKAPSECYPAGTSPGSAFVFCLK